MPAVKAERQTKFGTGPWPALPTAQATAQANVFGNGVFCRSFTAVVAWGAKEGLQNCLGAQHREGGGMGLRWWPGGAQVIQNIPKPQTSPSTDLWAREECF
jgi:hypothetical protein